jgi:Tol biopolymer transport system component
MKKLLIAFLIISVGFNVYFLVQASAKPSPKTTLEQLSKPLGLFQHEKNDWFFYFVKEGGIKEASGLHVAVQSNPNAIGLPEEIYASLSPNGKKVAYMQKPAWPHQIFVANIDGTEIKEFIGPILPAPTNANIENQFSWSEDGNNLIYAVTLQDCGPAGSGGTYETNIYKKNLLSQKEEIVLRLEHKCDDVSTGAKVIPVN